MSKFKDSILEWTSTTATEAADSHMIPGGALSTSDPSYDLFLPEDENGQTAIEIRDEIL